MDGGFFIHYHYTEPRDDSGLDPYGYKIITRYNAAGQTETQRVYGAHTDVTALPSGWIVIQPRSLSSN